MDARYKLIGTSGRFTGSEFDVGPGIHQVGRHASNQFVLGGDGSVSRNHARLTVTAAGVTVEDLRSTNGTLVNGKKVTRSAVKVGETVQFGDAVFRLEKAVEDPITTDGQSCPANGCPGSLTAAGVCTVCGERPISCPRCHALNSADSRFCRADGTRLRPADASARTPASTPVGTGASPDGSAGASAPTGGLSARKGGWIEPGDPAHPSAAPDSRTVSIPAASGLRAGSPVGTGPRAAVSPGPVSTGPLSSGSRGNGVTLTSDVLRQPDIARCPMCATNVGASAELCPRCHARVRRCASGHISPGSAIVCVRCKAALLPVPERWGVFRGAGGTGWIPEAIRPPFRLAWQYRPPEGRVNWTAPVIGGGAAYAACSDNFLYALQKGVALWRTPLDGAVRTEPVPETAVPAYSDGKVFVAHMGEALAAFQARSGEICWQTPLGGRPSSPPRPALGMIYLGVSRGPNANALCAFTVEGLPAWSYETDGTVYSCPAFVAGTLVITTAGGSVIALEASTGRLLWQHTEQGDEFGTSAAVSRDMVYTTSRAGKLLCLDLHSGEVKKRWDSPTGGYIHSSPALGSGPTDGELFFGADDHSIYVVSSATARTISHYATGGAVLGSPAIADGLAFVGSQDGSLYCIGPEAYRIEPAYKLTDGLHISSSPAIGDGQIVFAGSDGCVYSLESCPIGGAP